MSGDRIDLLHSINNLEQENEELREKATPNKVEKATREDYMNSGYKHCCPKCGNMVGTITNNLDFEHDDYCPSCGQALDWRDEE